MAIKLGQLLSTRRDLIPPEVLSQLVLLQDQVKPFDAQVAKQRIQESLKADVNTLFARFDEQPLAAASIAQVHTAALHDGREVVVKVTRPDIRVQILQDFEIITWLGQWLESRLEAARALHLTEIIQDYRQIILNELDLTIEADNTRRMRHYFTGSSMMYVPEVYMDSKDVMVAERITGVPISDTATFDRLGMDRAELAEKGLIIFFTQVFRDNFFHADMHPGNVFVETINPVSPRYIALDCAIMGELSKQDQMTVARMLLAVMNNNFMQLIQIVHQAGWIPPGTDQDALAREMRRTVTNGVKADGSTGFRWDFIAGHGYCPTLSFGNSTTIDVAPENTGACRRIGNRSLPSIRYLETGKADFDRMGQIQYESCQKHERNWSANSRFITGCA